MRRGFFHGPKTDVQNLALYTRSVIYLYKNFQVRNSKKFSCLKSSNFNIYIYPSQVRLHENSEGLFYFFAGVIVALTFVYT